MNLLRQTSAGFLLLLLIILLSWPKASLAMPPAPVDEWYPPDNAVLSNPNVNFRFPVVAGTGITYRLSVYESNLDYHSGQRVRTFLFSRTITFNEFPQTLAGLADTNIEWKVTAMQNGQTLGTTGFNQFRKFSFTGQGPNLSHIADQQRPVGTPIAFQVHTEAEPGHERTSQKAFRQCVRKIVSKGPKVIQTIGSAKKAKKKRAARARCGKKKSKTKKAGTAAASAMENYRITCLDKDTHEPEPCPDGMVVEPDGYFYYTGVEHGEYMVMMHYDYMGQSDTQTFMVRVGQSQYGNGVAPFLSAIVDLSNPNALTPLAQSASPHTGSFQKDHAVNGRINVGESYFPQNSTWSIKIKIDSNTDQRYFLVDKVWLNFGAVTGSAIPANTGQLTLAYSTDFSGADNSFTNVESSAMTLDPLDDPGAVIPGLASCTAIAEGCDGRIHVGRQATYLRLSGTGVRPALMEFVISGWQGEYDCSVLNDRWRTIAYLDTDEDRIPNSLQLQTVPCYGLPSMLEPGFSAPEEIEMFPDRCETDANKKEPGRCGCGFPEPACILNGDFDCSGKVEQADWERWKEDYGNDTPEVLMRYGGVIPNAAFYTTWRNNVGRECPAAGAEGTAQRVAAADGATAQPQGVQIPVDNCPAVANTNQGNYDQDLGAESNKGGDTCDVDDDLDGVQDSSDCAPKHKGRWRNQAYPDSDNDGKPNSGVLTVTQGCFGPSAPGGFTLNAGPLDQCPNDNQKSAPGICGCGILDSDGDLDGTMDCVDQCPADPAKTAPGLCGCGNPESCAMKPVLLSGVQVLPTLPNTWSSLPALTDGNDNTYTVLYPPVAGPSLNFDLGHRHAIGWIELRAYGGLGIADYDLEISDDNVKWTPIPGAQGVNTLSLPGKVDTGHVLGRYLRVNLKRAQSSFVVLGEAKIYGFRPQKVENVTAQEAQQGLTPSGISPQLMLDGNTMTYWYEYPFKAGRELNFDLGRNLQLSQLDLQTLGAPLGVNKFDLRVSYDGITYYPAPYGTMLSGILPLNRILFDGTITARYVKLVIKEAEMAPVITEASFYAFPPPQLDVMTATAPSMGGLEAGYLLDDDDDTLWATTPMGTVNVTLNFDGLRMLERFEFDEYEGMGAALFTLYYSENGTAFLPYQITNGHLRRTGKRVTVDLRGVRARKFRMAITGTENSMFVAMEAMRIYGSKVADITPSSVTSNTSVAFYTAANLLSDNTMANFYDFIGAPVGALEVVMNFPRVQDLSQLRFNGMQGYLPSDFSIYTRPDDTSAFTLAKRFPTASGSVGLDTHWYDVRGMRAKQVKIIIHNAPYAAVLLDHVGFIGR